MCRPLRTNSKIEVRGATNIESGVRQYDNPHREGFPKSSTCLLNGAAEISSDRAPSLHHAAQIQPAPRMFDAIRVTETEVALQVGPHRIGLNTTAFSSGAKVASVVLPAPGDPMIRICASPRLCLTF
jgi:hypothetical protein